MGQKVRYFKVAPKAHIFKALSYSSFQLLLPGQRVKIPLGTRTVKGLVLEETAPQGLKGIKEVLEWDENSPVLSPQRIRWLEWISSYYRYPLGMAADLSFLPAENFKGKKSPQLLTSSNKESLPQAPQGKGKPPSPSEKNRSPSFKISDVQLTQEQKCCADQILQQKGFVVHLIHGVTGSGKTEIYKKLIAHTLNQNQQALVLLPEIFLTPQIFRRFSESFPEETAVLHSQVTQKQKKQAWRDLLSSQKNLLLGTRSALFCPLPRLGIIIIDEEHDSSFKQDSHFRYHARDSALVLAKELNIPVVLGSATPDFSTYKHALDGSYRLYELKNRAFKQTLPKVTLVDLKNPPAGGRPFWLSDPLFEKIQETLKKGRQTALFLNRRGQARALICPQCGHTQKCLNCDISLTLHEDSHLICHYCSYLEKKPSHCPSCGGSEWLERGFGTQAVQKEIQKYFPGVKNLRVDRDSIPSHKEMKKFISAVEKNQVQIIIGTQMLSKGLNFPSVYLVGLILADMDFHFPDFRAEERTFQTLLQMAGRAGRTEFGEVMLQTFNPDHPSIMFAEQHDYKSFFHKAMLSRRKWLYPPFSRLCLLHMDSLKEKEGHDFAKEIVEKVKELAPPGLKVLGPSPAPLSKIKNRHRFQILIKAKNHRQLGDFLNQFLPQVRPKSFVRFKVDRDPLSML